MAWCIIKYLTLQNDGEVVMEPRYGEGDSAERRRQNANIFSISYFVISPLAFP